MSTGYSNLNFLNASKVYHSKSRNTMLPIPVYNMRVFME